VPEWGSVAGSPGRRAAEAAIHSPLQPEGEKLWEEGLGRRGGREHDRGVERSVWNGAKRRRRSRWERGTRERVARGGVRLLAGAGGYFHEGHGRGSTRGTRKRQSVAGSRRDIKGTTDTNTDCPSRNKPGTCGTRMWPVTRNQKERTGRAAAGRAGSFNPEEQRSSRFRSYGPPPREERSRSASSEEWGMLDTSQVQRSPDHNHGPAAAALHHGLQQCVTDEVPVKPLVHSTSLCL
jgi:hypothetical protein